MTHPQHDNFIEGDWCLVNGVQRFSHEAMATTFEVVILHEQASYAEQAAWAAFDELDRLEAELSRFIENSDVSRINNLAVGQSLRISLATFECLQLCERIYVETNGAFDITIGSLMDCWLGEDKTIRTPSKAELNLARPVRDQKKKVSNGARQRTGMHHIKLDEAQHIVELPSSQVQIDLGGIGKGYAVDKMAELLRDWGMDTALIHGGFSSVLALGRPPETKGWPITLSNPGNRKQTLSRLCLQDRAVGGSGLQKGRHIIDPRPVRSKSSTSNGTRTAQPAEGKCAAWASAPTAAAADALSTAFMVMSPDEIQQYCDSHPDTSALIIIEEGDKNLLKEKILQFGQWKKDDLLKPGNATHQRHR